MACDRGVCMGETVFLYPCQIIGNFKRTTKGSIAWVVISCVLSTGFAYHDFTHLSTLFTLEQQPSRAGWRSFAPYVFLISFVSMVFHTIAGALGLTILRTSPAPILLWIIISITIGFAVAMILLILRITEFDRRDYKPVVSYFRSAEFSTIPKQGSWNGRLHCAYNAERISIVLPFHEAIETQEIALTSHNNHVSLTHCSGFFIGFAHVLQGDEHS